MAGFRALVGNTDLRRSCIAAPGSQQRLSAQGRHDTVVQGGYLGLPQVRAPGVPREALGIPGSSEVPFKGESGLIFPTSKLLKTSHQYTDIHTCVYTYMPLYMYKIIDIIC